MPTLRDVLAMDREKLKAFTRPDDFAVEPLSMGEDQRLSIYTAPIAGHQYVAGADFAYGIDGRDYDTLIIADKHTDPVEQVAELEGRWGADRFDRLLYCMLRYYFNAFLVGEKQVGLPVLRSLLNNFGYGYLYYNRDESKRGRPRKDALGHHKGTGDPTIHNLRRAVRDKKFLLRSERAVQQIGAYQFRPKGREQEKTEDLRDSDLTMGAPSGEFDDLVNAAAYCWKGVEEVHFYAEDRPPFEEGKAGDILGMAEALRDGPKAKPKSAFSRYST